MGKLQLVDQLKIELEGFKSLADTRMQFIEWLCNKHGIDLLEESSTFEQQDFEDAMREAIAAGGGCPMCGDLTGFECICED